MFSFRFKRRGRSYRVTLFPRLRRLRTNQKALGRPGTASSGTKREKLSQRLRLGSKRCSFERSRDWHPTLLSRETCCRSENTAWPIF